LIEHQNAKLLADAKLAENEALKRELDARIAALVLVRASLDEDDNGSEKSYDPYLMNDVEDSVSVDSYDPEKLCFSDEEQEKKQAGSEHEDPDQDLTGFAVTDA
jgi:hypothetical protein